MTYEEIRDIDPYIRMMRVKKTYGLTGKWRDLDHVFTYLVSGSADFIIGGVSHTLTAGDVILFPPLLTHMIIQRDQQLLTQYIFHFDFYEDKRRTAIPNHDILGSEDENIVPKKELLMKNEAVISHFSEELRQEFMHQYLMMRAEFMDHREGREYFLKQYCRMILAMTLRSAEPEKMDELKNKKAWALVEKTVNFLNSVPVDEELSNDEIAFHIGVSPNYLTKSFSECLGVSLHQYIIMMRMEKAQKLLLSGKENNRKRRSGQMSGKISQGECCRHAFCDAELVLSYGNH